MFAKFGYKSFDADPGCDGRRYDRGLPILTGSSAIPPSASRGNDSPARKCGGCAIRKASTCSLASCVTIRGPVPGWDVMMLQDGEPLLSRRCVDERGARYVAESFRHDTVRAGWVE